MNCTGLIRNFVMALLLIGFLAIGALVSALEYVESSQGLSDPQWEGGRTEIEFADLNLDGNLDLISIGDHGSPYINTQEHGVMVYFGNGQGRWQVYQNGNFGYGGVAVGDVNGDGLPDIGYAMHHNYSSTDFGDQLIEVALGDGSGQNWTPWDDNLASQGESYGMFSTDFGDLDNDGDLDLAATSFGYGNPLMIYLNDGDGSWTFSQAVTTGNSNMYIFLGDINRDGNLDLVTSYQNGSVFFGDGTGHFTNAQYNLPVGGTYGLNGISLGDVDGDGGMDLAYTYNNGVYVWCYNEAMTVWENYSGNLPTTGGYKVTQLADLNADGFCDVAAAGSGQVSIWTGDGTGRWILAANYIIDNDPDCYFEAFRVGGDVDHNGYPDLVHLTDEGSWINSYNHLRFYRETSVADSLTIMPCFPRGGEVFKSGSTRFTDWLSQVPAGQTATVTVELSTTGVSGAWTLLAQDLPNNGRLQWVIPQVQTSSNCHLRYTATTATGSASALTPAPFTILGTALNLEVTLDPINPPIIIPATGGSFSFDISLINHESSPVPCQVWTNITLPDGRIYGPIINASLTAPIGTISRTRTQNIPASARPGDYYHNAFVGIYPNQVWSSDSFPFTKEGSGNWELGAGGWGPGSGDWSNVGASFEIANDEFSIHNSSFTISTNPNPFNAATKIRFTLPEAAQVTLEVFDVKGRRVGAIHELPLQAGTHEIPFDGSHLPSGIYFARLITGDYSALQKLVLLK